MQYFGRYDDVAEEKYYISWVGSRFIIKTDISRLFALTFSVNFMQYIW